MMPRLFFIVLLLPVCSSHGAIYRWVDANDKVHFTDNPSDDTRTEEVELQINTYTSVEIKTLVERLGKKDKVVIYGTSWCHTCDKARHYFRKNLIFLTFPTTWKEAGEVKCISSYFAEMRADHYRRKQQDEWLLRLQVRKSLSTISEV